jgi:FMN phosphatase YigB (HAD superfamily)
MSIRVVAFDIYGTVLASDDNDNQFSPRSGFYEIVKRCKSEGRIVVSASDASIDDQKRDFREVARSLEGRNEDILGLRLFDNLFRLFETPKEFSIILNYYKIRPSELFVFGDNYEKDIMGAMNIGSPYLHVPEYRIRKRGSEEFLPRDTFSFAGIRLD